MRIRTEHVWLLIFGCMSWDLSMLIGFALSLSNRWPYIYGTYAGTACTSWLNRGKRRNAQITKFFQPINFLFGILALNQNLRCS